MQAQNFVPELCLLLFAGLILFGGLFQRRESTVGVLVRQGQWLLGAALLWLGYTLFFAPSLVADIHSIYIKDYVSFFFTAFILLLLWPWLTIRPQRLAQMGIHRFEYYVLLSLAVLGMFVMVSANNMLTAYLGIELQSLPLYALIGMRRTEPSALEASLKYFVLGALASGLMLFGMALVYGATGALNFVVIQQAMSLNSSAIFVLGSCLVLSGLFFKVAAAPFHMWAPDVYEGSTNVQAAVISTGSKIATLVILIRLLYGTFMNLTEIWHYFVIGVVLISLYVGALGGLFQTNVRRLMAYSGIGHMGYVLMAFLAGVQELSALFTYIVAYFVSLLLFFGCLTALQKDGKEISDLTAFKGLGRDHPLLASMFSVSLFSMIGMPPLAGFWGKLYILLLTIESHYYFVAILAVIASVISTYYYLRIIKFMYFDQGKNRLSVVKPIWPYLFPTLFIIGFGYFQIYLQPVFGVMVEQLVTQV